VDVGLPAAWLSDALGGSGEKRRRVLFAVVPLMRLGLGVWAGAAPPVNCKSMTYKSL